MVLALVHVVQFSSYRIGLFHVLDHLECCSDLIVPLQHGPRRVPIPSPESIMLQYAVFSSMYDCFALLHPVRLLMTLDVAKEVSQHIFVVISC